MVAFEALIIYICAAAQWSSKEIRRFFSLAQSLGKLASKQIEIATAIDIGANVGQWYKTFASFFPSTTVLSIEANPFNMPSLLRENPNSRNLCLSKLPDVDVTFYLPDPETGADNTGASYYKEVLSYYNNPQVITLKSHTLDQLHSTFDYVKIDTQGAELDILQGGHNTLRMAKFVQVELSVKQYNSGAPLAAEVIAHLHALGFFLFDLTEIMYYGGEINQFDGIFVSKSIKKILDI